MRMQDDFQYGKKLNDINTILSKNLLKQRNLIQLSFDYLRMLEQSKRRLN